MRAHDICGYRRRRRVRTTIPEPADTAVPDLLGREFIASAPNRVYVGDITYLPLAAAGNLYLATVIEQPDMGPQQAQSYLVKRHFLLSGATTPPSPVKSQG